MANAYNYSNIALETTLAGNISAGATTVSVVATSGFPGSVPYVLALDYGAVTEELVNLTGVAGLALKPAHWRKLLHNSPLPSRANPTAGRTTTSPCP